MAERRMFTKTIIDSDAFLDMPLSTQTLYFHLSMRADDDGFVNNPKKIQRMIGCADDDLKLLIAKRFVLVFESGVIVIKHWKMHNYIQKDRYKPTVYQQEKGQLEIKKNGSYTLLDAKCIQDGYSLETQVRLGKDRLELINNMADKPPKFKTLNFEEVPYYYKEQLDPTIPPDSTDNCEANAENLPLPEYSGSTTAALPPNRKEKKRKDINMTDLEADKFFESVWKLYPRKEGKGRVSKTQKKKLYKEVGYEQFIRCIERYKEAKKKEDPKYIQHGSTFFNSGYMDYIDKEDQEKKPIQSVKPIKIIGMMGD